MNGTSLQSSPLPSVKITAVPSAGANQDSAASPLSDDPHNPPRIRLKETDVEPRIAELETHLKYLRKHLGAVEKDLKSVKYRLVFSTGVITVLIGLVSWIANSRFDQLVTLLN